MILKSKFSTAVVSWILCFAFIAYLSLTSHPLNTKENLFRGTIGCLGYLLVQGLNSSTRLPFYSIGKIPQMLRGIQFFYICLLIVILTSNHKDAMYIISIFSAKPSEEDLEAHYTPISDCTLSYTHFFRTFNIYFVAHFFGWIFHGLILRDLLILHSWSFLTEFIGTLRFKVENTPWKSGCPSIPSAGGTVWSLMFFFRTSPGCLLLVISSRR